MHSDKVFFKSYSDCPGWVAQLAGASSHIPKGCGFNAQSGCAQEAIDVPPPFLSSISTPSGEEHTHTCTHMGTCVHTHACTHSDIVTRTAGLLVLE